MLVTNHSIIKRNFKIKLNCLSRAPSTHQHAIPTDAENVVFLNFQLEFQNIISK